MILYPAIDLKDGRCVRLVRGAMDSETVYNDDPAAQAREFAAAGFQWLHVVDLNGAVEGAPANASAVRDILGAVDIPVQLGGGIRNPAQIEHWLETGVERVILGTVAVKNPDMVRQACRTWPGRIAVGIDSVGDVVSTEGWVETTDSTIEDLIKEYRDCGLAAVIHTDITRDGTGLGLNMDSTIALARAIGLPVIASGGAASLDDVRAVKAAEKDGVAGMIIGKALYDGRIDPAAALEIAGV